MAYYVLGSGGAKYGPVDVGTLNQWAADGRVGPETLVEDAGSGVKTPARAVRGLKFANGAATTAPIPAAGPAVPSAPLASQSNYVRPGQGTGGSPHNLYLPPSAQDELQPSVLRGQGLFLPNDAQPHLESNHNLFLPNVDSKWAWQGFACVAVAVASGALIGFTHWYFDKIVVFAFALPIFGVQRGYRGLGVNRPLAVIVIALNLLAMLGAFAFVFKGFFG